MGWNYASPFKIDIVGGEINPLTLSDSPCIKLRNTTSTRPAQNITWQIGEMDPGDAISIHLNATVEEQDTGGNIGDNWAIASWSSGGGTTHWSEPAVIKW